MINDSTDLLNDDNFINSLIQKLSTNTDFINSFAKNPNFVESLAKNSLFPSTLIKNSTFVSLLARNQNFIISLAKNPVFIEALVKNPDFKSEIDNIIDEDLTITDGQIADLQDEINNIKINPKMITPVIEDIETDRIIVTNKTEYCAFETVKLLNSLPKNFAGERTLTNSLFYQAWENVPEEYRPDTKNKRQAKRDICNFIVKIYKGIRRDKSKNGNRDVRLVMNPNFDSGILKRIEVSV